MVAQCLRSWSFGLPGSLSHTDNWWQRPNPWVRFEYTVITRVQYPRTTVTLVPEFGTSNVFIFLQSAMVLLLPGWNWCLQMRVNIRSSWSNSSSSNDSNKYLEGEVMVEWPVDKECFMQVLPFEIWLVGNCCAA